jgi:mono/diheme cytochrome c family protein
MSSDVRKIIYGTLIAFIGVICLWLGFLFVVACNGTLGCIKGEPTPVRTSIPTLAAATMPAPQFPTAAAGGQVETARVAGKPSVPGGPGEAIQLTGDAAAGEKMYAGFCEACHGSAGTGGVENPGSASGVIPTLNPIATSIASADKQTFASNIDLFIQHGSRPEGDAPARSMPAWGDQGALTQQQIADLIAYIISLNQ